MSPGIPTKVIASSMGLAAFVIATVAGLAADNPAENILTRAIVSMFACHVLGFVVGLLAEKAVTDGIVQYVSAGTTDLSKAATREPGRPGRSGGAKSAVSA